MRLGGADGFGAMIALITQRSVVQIHPPLPRHYQRVIGPRRDALSRAFLLSGVAWLRIQEILEPVFAASLISFLFPGSYLSRGRRTLVGGRNPSGRPPGSAT